VGDEPRVPGEAKSETLAAFAAAIDLSGESVTPGQTRAPDSVRAAAARHLSAALEIMRGAKGGDA